MKYWWIISILGLLLIGMSFITEVRIIGLPGMLVLGTGFGLWWSRNDPTTNPNKRL